MIQPAERLSLVQEYYFSRKLKEVAQLNAEGKDIISLAIGSPDMPPSEKTIEKLCEVARQPNAHGYQPTQGTPELRQAMAGFYKRWYDVDLDDKSEHFQNMMRKAGAKEVHVRISSPAFLYPCFYGTDVPDNSQLIASEHSTEQIRVQIGADSLEYMHIEDFEQMTGDLEICKACFDGKYPV